MLSTKVDGASLGVIHHLSAAADLVDDIFLDEGQPSSPSDMFLFFSNSFVMTLEKYLTLTLVNAIIFV
jgi:hypothetical protein